MSQLRLRSAKVLIPLRILLQLTLLKLRHRVSIHRNDLILLVEQLDVLRFPFGPSVGGRRWGFVAEEYEAAIALHVEFYAVHVESMCDCGLHLPDCAMRGWVQVDEGAVFAVHDEVTAGAAAFGYFDEVVDAEASGPC